MVFDIKEDAYATSIEFIEYVCEQVRGVGSIRYRKVFGDYMVYIHEKPILLICDSTVYVKKLDGIKEKMIDASIGIPYKDAKEYYILDIDNADFSREIIECLDTITPLPKPKIRRTSKKV